MHNHRTRIKLILTFFMVLTVTLIISRTFKIDFAIESGIIGTMYTFFYGLYINSLLQLLHEKFINFRILIGEIIGRAQSIYNITLLMGNKNITNKMRKELIIFLQSYNDLSPENYYNNQYEIDKMYSILNDIKVKNDKDAQNYSRIVQLIDDLCTSREKLEIFGRRNLSAETKIIVIATTTIFLVIISEITLAQANIYLNTLGVLFIMMVIFVMIFMFNLDNLTYGTHAIKTKNIESIINELKGNDRKKNS